MARVSDRGRKALLAINRALAGGIPSQGVFEAIVAEAVGFCDAERGFLLLEDEAGDGDQIVAAVPQGAAGVSSEVARLVRDSGEPLLTVDAQGDPRLEPSRSILDQAIRSVMAVPLVADGRLLGVLYVDSRGRRRNFEANDLELLAAFADQAALAVKLATLKRELEEQLREARELSELADRDGLTGLLNRRAFDRMLAERMHLTSTGPLALILLDVDHFKAFNDRYGHPAGDEALRRVARLLEASLRLTGGRGADVVARYGGEEFAVILPDTPLANAELVAERLRMRVARSRFPVDDGRGEVRLTVSLGLAEAPRHGRTPPTLIVAADEALYQAKGLGRNRVVGAR